MSDPKDLNQQNESEQKDDNQALSYVEQVNQNDQTQDDAEYSEPDLDKDAKDTSILDAQEDDVDNEEEDTKGYASSETTPSATAPSIAKPSVFKSIKFFLLIAIIILGVAVVFYLAQGFKKQDEQLMILKNELNAKIELLDKKYNYQSVINQLNEKDAQLLQQINAMSVNDNSALQTQLNAQNTQLEAFRQQLVNAATQFNRSEQFKTIEWQLAEAKYLLRIAQQRIVMEKDVNSALAILHSVDSIFVETGDVSLYNLRTILASDKATLESVSTVDVEGIYIQLGNIRNQVEQFQFVNPIEIAPTDKKLSFTERFNSMVKVRDISGQYVGQLDPVLHNIAKQTLVLMIEQTQSALLNNQQPVFELSIAKSKTQLNQYFSTEAQYDWMIKQLDEVKSINLNSSLPNVLKSINALDQYLINLSE